MTNVVARAPRSTRVTSGLVRVIWFGVVPALLTASVLRYLLPSPIRAPEGALRALSVWAAARPLPLSIGLFLMFGLLLRYWRHHLPGHHRWEGSRVETAAGARDALLSAGLVVVAGALAFLVRSSVFQTYRVLSGSMLPTLQPGEVVVAKQFAYGARLLGLAPRTPRLPRRGDVVVFHRAPERPDVPEELVKRVIGLPGDTVSSYGGFVKINGWPVPTCSVGPYVFISGDGMLEAQLRLEFLGDSAYLTARAPALPESSEPYTVQPGEVYVMGDSRNNSSDSRAWNGGRGGGLPIGEIHGQVERFLFGRHRNGDIDWTLFLQLVGRDVRGEGLDLSEVREGIARCLKERPRDTHPPPPGRSPP